MIDDITVGAFANHIEKLAEEEKRPSNARRYAIAALLGATTKPALTISGMKAGQLYGRLAGKEVATHLKGYKLVEDVVKGALGGSALLGIRDRTVPQYRGTRGQFMAGKIKKSIYNDTPASDGGPGYETKLGMMGGGLAKATPGKLMGGFASKGVQAVTSIPGVRGSRGLGNMRAVAPAAVPGI